MAISQSETEVQTRARSSLGTSNTAIYRMVQKVLEKRNISGHVVLDVGCGQGLLRPFITYRFSRYIGIDVVKYEGYPVDAEFKELNLDSNQVDLPQGYAEAVVAVETIEHLENPRLFFRELTRLVKPGGWIVVTTPNQLSVLSLMTLVIKKQFSNFQDVHYPAHLTALLEIDLLRIAEECGLSNLGLEYSLLGRIPFTSRHYPKWLAKLFPRALSDNLLLVGQRA